MIGIDAPVIVLIVVAAVFLAAALAVRGRVGLVLLSAGLFTLLAALAVGINSASMSGLDTSVAIWFDDHRTRRRDLEAVGIFGYIGRPIHVLIPALVLGTLLSLRVRSVLPVACVTGGVGIGVVVEGTLKAVIGRTATTGPLVDYPHSYPSGHVTGTSALLGMIAICLGVGRSRRVKLTVSALAVAGVVCVAFLALYTGAHTFTDVIGGMFLGGAICALGAALLGGSGPAAANRPRSVAARE
ncbi:MAG: phosphatase PAP2 family protein [Mycobacterium sp.]|nr:phosphatase PAP2 family protein [Mycobacterium sp.]